MIKVREVSAVVGPGEAEPRRVWLDVWKEFSRKVDEKKNRDSLILELSDSLLFIVLWKWFPSRLNLVWLVTLYPLNFHAHSLFLAKQNVLLFVKSAQCCLFQSNLPHRCTEIRLKAAFMMTYNKFNIGIDSGTHFRYRNKKLPWLKTTKWTNK